MQGNKAFLSFEGASDCKEFLVTNVNFEGTSDCKEFLVTNTNVNVAGNA
jgi:hypothetical protein